MSVIYIMLSRSRPISNKKKSISDDSSERMVGRHDWWDKYIQYTGGLTTKEKKGKFGCQPVFLYN
jgi:hypothetical protein